MSEDVGRVLLTGAELVKWQRRYDELGGARELAGLFRGWMPAGFPESAVRILYVGKATSGPFQGEHVERDSFNKDKNRSFWGFARTIATAVGCDGETLRCIAWSNLSKISRPQIAADPSLIAGFEEAAAATLETEIAATAPSIVVFVTNHFGDKAVRLVSQCTEDWQWNRSENEMSDSNVQDVWWRRRKDGIAVLWMRHPQGASSTKLSYAASKVASLATGAGR